MTFTDIQTRVADRLNLTSAAALTRIGQEINERHREIVSSLGLNRSSFGPVTATTTIGNRSLTFTCEKVFAVYDNTASSVRLLSEVTFPELRLGSIDTNSAATRYAIQAMAASTVTIYLDAIPATAYVLTADAELNTADLSGTNSPAFSQDFHDVLVRGVLADELYKLEKYNLSAAQETKFEKRLSELRFFIAKSANLASYSGKLASTSPTSFIRSNLI